MPENKSLDAKSSSMTLYCEPRKRKSEPRKTEVSKMMSVIGVTDLHK